MSSLPADFLQRLATVAAKTDSALTALISGLARPGEIARPERLLEAMLHSTAGGKRLRPFIVVESAALFGCAPDDAIPVGVAFECVHCYSLVHDDLPAMDDDAVRRNRPTTHAAFDEATAILAGDALLTLAFDHLASADFNADARTRIALIALLARAAGVGGMAGGQLLDLAAEGRFASDRQPLSLGKADIERLQTMKTGALFAAACEAGAILGRGDDRERNALASFGHAFGLAFQIADDLIDADGDPRVAGKATAKDAAKGKATLVSLLGADGARRRLAQLIVDAERALAPFGSRAESLAACARWIAEGNAL